MIDVLWQEVIKVCYIVLYRRYFYIKCQENFNQKLFWELIQKQSFISVLDKRHPQKCCKVRRKISVMQSFFSKKNLWKITERFLKGISQRRSLLIIGTVLLYLIITYYITCLLNPFHATDLFLYSLKTLKNQGFSDVFRGYIKRPVTRNGLFEQ